MLVTVILIVIGTAKRLPATPTTSDEAERPKPAKACELNACFVPEAFKSPVSDDTPKATQVPREVVISPATPQDVAKSTDSSDEEESTAWKDLGAGCVRVVRLAGWHVPRNPKIIASTLPVDQVTPPKEGDLMVGVTYEGELGHVAVWENTGDELCSRVDSVGTNRCYSIGDPVFKGFIKQPNGKGIKPIKHNINHLAFVIQ